MFEGPLRNTNGELVADGSADLWNGAIDAPIKYDETGQEVTTNLEAWTGSNSSGEFDPGNTASDWTNNTSSGDGVSGAAQSTSFTWIAGVPNPCNSQLRLYGVLPVDHALRQATTTIHVYAEGGDLVVTRTPEGGASSVLFRQALGATDSLTLTGTPEAEHFVVDLAGIAASDLPGGVNLSGGEDTFNRDLDTLEVRTPTQASLSGTTHDAGETNRAGAVTNSDGLVVSFSEIETEASLVPGVELTIEKSSPEVQVTQGDAISYTITVRNEGALDLDGVEVRR